MRTTLTIDDDVAALLKNEMRKSGRALKQVVNDRLRKSYTAREAQRKPFKVTSWSLQPPPGLSFDKVEELIEHLEGPHHR